MYLFFCCFCSEIIQIVVANNHSSYPINSSIQRWKLKRSNHRLIRPAKGKKSKGRKTYLIVCKEKTTSKQNKIKRGEKTKRNTAKKRRKKNKKKSRIERSEYNCVYLCVNCIFCGTCWIPSVITDSIENCDEGGSPFDRESSSNLSSRFLPNSFHFVSAQKEEKEKFDGCHLSRAINRTLCWVSVCACLFSFFHICLSICCCFDDFEVEVKDCVFCLIESG